MRSSVFKTPLYYDTVCDLSAESIVQSYTDTRELYQSNISSHIINNKLYINGYINANNHFSESELIKEIKHNINYDIDIEFNVLMNKLSDKIFVSDTYIGYYCTENSNGIPFEHDLCKSLSIYLYETYKIPAKIILTVNGNGIDVFIETNYFQKSAIFSATYDFLSRLKNYYNINIEINSFKNQHMFRSNISNYSYFYGPRSPYGSSNYIGLDIYNNAKYSMLISRLIAKDYSDKNRLNYCLSELSYHNEMLPLQIGIKGNIGGIHLENGTFFDKLSDYSLYNKIKNNMFIDIFNSKISLLDIIKYGINCID